MPRSTGPLKDTGIDYTETPLEQVVNSLQDEYGIPIQLDTPALQDAGLNPQEPITVNLHNIALRSALRLMLKQHQVDLHYSERSADDHDARAGGDAAGRQGLSGGRLGVAD